MRILRSAVAIVAGFWFMATTARVGTLVAARVLMPHDIHNAAMRSTVPAAYLAALLAVSALGSMMGGWLAARLAPSAPFAHACALAAMSAAMSAALLLEPPDLSRLGPQLWWYTIANGVIGALAVLLGGKLRAAAAADHGFTAGQRSKQRNT